MGVMTRVIRSRSYSWFLLKVVIFAISSCTIASIPLESKRKDFFYGSTNDDEKEEQDDDDDDDGFIQRSVRVAQFALSPNRSGYESVITILFVFFFSFYTSIYSDPYNFLEITIRSAL